METDPLPPKALKHQFFPLKNDKYLCKGGYFKDERSLGGRGGRQNAISDSNNDVIVYSNN